MIKYKFVIITLISLFEFINLKAQNIDTTANTIVMRIVESNFLGVSSKISIYEKGRIEELELTGFIDSKKNAANNFKIISHNIEAVLSRGYKIVSSTCGSGTVDTMNSYLITTYIFEKN